MNDDQFKNESVYDHDRIERHLWQLERTTGFTRRQVVKLIAAGGIAAAGGIIPATLRRAWATPSASVVKPTPSDLFIMNTTETFEANPGTDNVFETKIEKGNGLNPDFQVSAGMPQSWGLQCGLVSIGAQHGSAFWMQRDAVDSPTGYYFSGSFIVAVDGLGEGKAITLFISKPMDWSGPWACWRLYCSKGQGQLMLVLVMGLNTATQNPSYQVHHVPIAVNVPYDVSILYDTARRWYSWVVNGQLQAYAAMPSDWPLIATKIIGSSGSSGGRNSAFLVDNARWYELP